MINRRFMPLAIAAVAVAVIATAVSAQQAASYEVVSSFQVAEGRPNGVIQTRDGQFYGTTAGGGAATDVQRASGIVFAMDAAGARTTLHTFYFCAPCNFFADGTPLSNLFEGPDGSLYGTTHNPNLTVFPGGRIFRIRPAGDFTTLSFAHWLRAGVIQARDGSLYGTAYGEQINSFLHSYGFVFRVESNGTRTDLHEFVGTDSAFPAAELVEIDDGSLYGTTEGGFFFPTPGVPPPNPPTPIPGAIFRLDPATGSFAIRHVFSGPDGSRPTGRLIQGTDGLVYGTTTEGGAYGFGTVFSFDAAGTLTTLHHFAGHDGANPGAGVIQGFDGRLYGITGNGGAFNYGTVFVMNVTGGLTTLHDFVSGDGTNPVNELFQANDGAFYGAAADGPDGGGVIFRVRLTTTPTDQYFELVSRNSGKCLDVFGASTGAGASVIQWVCHGGPNQQWRIEPAGGGAVRIIARHSGQALDVFGASLSDGAPIIQWPVHGEDNQAWTLEPAS